MTAWECVGTDTAGKYSAVHTVLLASLAGECRDKGTSRTPPTCAASRHSSAGCDTAGQCSDRYELTLVVIDTTGADGRRRSKTKIRPSRVQAASRCDCAGWKLRPDTIEPKDGSAKMGQKQQISAMQDEQQQRRNDLNSATISVQRPPVTDGW